MKKDVMVTLKSVSRAQEGEDEPVELTTQGRYYRKNGDYYISYQESELMGMEGSKTTIRVSPDMVTILRFGTFGGQMVFELGKKHLSHYDMQFGSLNMGVSTKKLEKEFDDRGGRLHLAYDLEVDNMLLGETTLTLQVREKGPGLSMHVQEGEGR